MTKSSQSGKFGRAAKARRGLFVSTKFRLTAALLLSLTLIASGCFMDTEVEPYYGQTVTPRAQELRWSDGGLPQTFDPAIAAAPPDTDAVRAMFEGLTDYDSRTLAPVPGVAEKWESTPDGLEWVFHLRKDARWSNGDAVTARDFVLSWKRTLELGDRAPHARLLENIAGVERNVTNPSVPLIEQTPLTNHVGDKSVKETKESGGKEPETVAKDEAKRDAKKDAKPEPPPAPKFGAEALDDYTLRVRLQHPDMNFPALVAHPVFRPVHNSAQQATGNSISAPPITNGPFQLTKSETDGVSLERASNYWDAQAVTLQRVRFVASRDAESALAAYRAGEVDAVTNAGFEPLAVKLLAPYKDFSRTTYGAVTYYSFNTGNAPFSDVRVREALALAIDRERISEDELGGVTEPAEKFLPAASEGKQDNQSPALARDPVRAQRLLAEAGFPNGEKFPHVRLLINRNETQRQVAQAIAAMWKSVLNIETDISAKNWDEYELTVNAGQYDVARRSMVMQTTDEATNMRLMFEQDAKPEADAQQPTTTPAASPSKSTNTQPGNDKTETAETRPPAPPPVPQISTEAQALKELPAMPIYFASSYALVKPYVVGFESNLLDAPSLKNVRMDTTWQPPKRTSVAWFK